MLVWLRGQNVIFGKFGAKMLFWENLGLKCEFGIVWGQNVILWNFGVNV